jgi:hypothetical protein
MPIIRYKDKICHFAHIPKCGGSSIESYLMSISGVKLGFLDRFVRSSHGEWNVSSSQHIDGDSLARIFPADFFNLFLAVVRHPIVRFESAFKFQKYTEKTIAHDVTIDDFVNGALRKNYLKKGWMDHHFHPQLSMLFPDQSYTFFKLENNGIRAAKAYIDQKIIGENINYDIGHTNVAAVPSGVE